MYLPNIHWGERENRPQSSSQGSLDESHFLQDHPRHDHPRHTPSYPVIFARQLLQAILPALSLHPRNHHKIRKQKESAGAVRVELHSGGTERDFSSLTCCPVTSPPPSLLSGGPGAGGLSIKPTEIPGEPPEIPGNIRERGPRYKQVSQSSPVLV